MTSWSIPKRRFAAVVLALTVATGVYAAFSKMKPNFETGSFEWQAVLPIFLVYAFTVVIAWNRYRQAIFWEMLRESNQQNRILLQNVEASLQTAEKLFGWRNYTIPMLVTIGLGTVLGFSVFYFVTLF